MQYILTSSSSVVTQDWMQHFSKKSEMKAVFIDTAAGMYDKSEAEWLLGDRRALEEAGFSVSDYTLVGKTKAELLKDLSDIDLIFVAGGNTFLLLEHAQKSGFIELLQENAFPDATYVGSSAGSVLLSNDINIIRYLDDPKVANVSSTKGAGIIDFVFLPHWGSEYFAKRYQELFTAAYSEGTSLFTLTDDQYLVVDGSTQQLYTRKK